MTRARLDSINENLPRRGVVRSLLRHIVRLIGYGAPAVVLTLIVVYVFVQQQRPDLESWHMVDLDAEFTASQARQITTLQDYLEMEAVLFQQLDEQVFAVVPVEKQRRFLRFSRGSQADSRNRTPDWNRTIERTHPQARGAALLLHGLSDSPYSLRSMAGLLYGRGLNVLTMRLPGHGTPLPRLSYRAISRACSSLPKTMISSSLVSLHAVGLR